MGDIKEKHGYVALDYNKERAKSIDYALPNGKIIQLQDERFKCGEVLFSFLKQNSLNRQVFECINKCSTEKRASLFGNIAISGGCSKFRAVQNRMQSKLQSLCKKSKNKSVKKCKINIVADKNRHIASWRGGSIIGGFPGFGNHWFTKQEYEEYGAALNEKMEKENVFYSFNEYEPREIDFDEIQKRDKRKRKKNAKKNIKYEYTASLNPQSTDSTLAASINPGMTFQKAVGSEMTSRSDRNDSDLFKSLGDINEEDSEEEEEDEIVNKDRLESVDILDFLATPAGNKQVIQHKKTDSGDIFGGFKTLIQEDEADEPDEEPWTAGQGAVAIVDDEPPQQIQKYPKKKVIAKPKRKSNISLKPSTPRATPIINDSDVEHRMSEMELEIEGYKEDLKQLKIENDGLRED